MKLNEILDLDPPVPAVPVVQTLTVPIANAPVVTPPAPQQVILVPVVPEPVVAGKSNNTVADDASDVRARVRILMAQGAEAAKEMLALARDLKTPRAYEVAGNLLKSMSELGQDLLQVHQQEKTLEEPADTGDINIKQAVFVGSTSDLGELVKLKRAERKNANTITVQATNITDVQAETSLPTILPQEPAP